MSNDTDNRFVLRRATIQDTPIILRCIRELADYEGIGDQCVATDAQLRDTLFAPDATVNVTLAFAGGEPAGFALWFRNYSTLLARPGIYLEDLFVFEPFRGRGLGRILLSSLARIAIDRNYGRVEWGVLSWNTQAIGFYESIGAAPVRDWTTYRLAGAALALFAEAAPPERQSE